MYCAILNTRRYVVNDSGSDDMSEEEEALDYTDSGVNISSSDSQNTDRNFSTNWGPIGYNKRNHPLSIMVSCYTHMWTVY